MASCPTEKPCFSNGNGILCVGLPRSGTSSLTAALERLNCVPVHHAIRIDSVREWYAWATAAYCHFPFLRRLPKLPYFLSPYDPLLPWTRNEWDRLIGRWRATTDMGSWFTAELLDAYPEAKVIVVERPVEQWIESFDNIFLSGWIFNWRSPVLCQLGVWVGLPQGYLMRRMITGYLGTNTARETLDQLPKFHHDHYAMVRRVVPPQQLLEYRLEDGWEPLCKFLGVPIPDEPFPKLNDRATMLKARNQRFWVILSRFMMKAIFWGFFLAMPALIRQKWRDCARKMLVRAAAYIDLR